MIELGVRVEAISIIDRNVGIELGLILCMSNSNSHLGISSLLLPYLAYNNTIETTRRHVVLSSHAVCGSPCKKVSRGYTIAQQ
jgi:hypothetical protein